MSRQSQFEASFGIAKRVMSRLAELKMRAAPRNYMLWYAYFDGTRPELTKDVDDTLKREGGLSQSMLDAIFDRHFGAGEEGDQLRSTADKIEHSVAQVLSLLDQAGTDAKDYGRSLQGLGKDLEAAPAADQVRAVVRKLVSATRDMAVRAQGMETRLKTSADEITALKQDLEDTRREASIDALTGIVNRRHFDERLKAAAAHAQETSEPLSLLMLDVDHFKRFNDTYGHQMGDEVLRLVARELKNNVKGRDTAARYGGEEFAIILPATTLDNAVRVANQIRAMVEQRRIVKTSNNEVLAAITMSIGVAGHRPGEAPEAFVARADAALYAAKSAGRNRVKAEDDAAPRPAAAAE